MYGWVTTAVVLVLLAGLVYAAGSSPVKQQFTLTMTQEWERR
jgi:hypothetical protein